MTKAADLIEALLARKPGRPVLDRRSGLPYAWGHWVRNRDVVADVAYAAPELVEVAAQRPSRRAAGVLPVLTPLQAFRRLWWQQWDPRPRDERPYHWLAVLGSLLIHLLFLLLLIWVAVVRWGRPPEPAGEEGRVRLEMIGRGSPDQIGGGQGEPDAGAAANAPAAKPAQASAARPRPATATPKPAQAAAAPAPAPAPANEASVAEPVSPEVQVPAMTVPTPQIAEPVIASQPLQVTETTVQTHEFVVPPTRAVEVQAPTPREVATPQVQVIERQVEVAQQPQLTAPRVREVDTPALPSREPTVREREVATVDAPAIDVPQPQTRPVEVTARTPELQVRQIEVPSMADAPAAPAAAEATAQPAVDASQSPSSAVAAAQSAPSPATNAAAASSANPATGTANASTTASRNEGAGNNQRTAGNPAATTGSGPRAADRRGGLETTTRGDDWSTGQQNRAGDATAQGGQGQGLFNADGSVRVPGESGSAPERGAPGGDSDHWTRERIASSGTWLKRPPYDYEPTSFDQYWVPSESLLAEWVRDGVKKIEIPIPGTNTKISCVVSLLQFGGGCGLRDPNQNDQPAQARPPPDIPFKKDLQEANGSVR